MQTPTYRKVTGPILVTTATRTSKWILSTTRRPTIEGILSISDPLGRPTYDRPSNLRSMGSKVMWLTFENDLVPCPTGPTVSDIESILAFGRQHHAAFTDPAHPRKIIIHCYAGRSRSTAAAFICYCQALGVGREREAWELMKSACEVTDIHPNTLMIDMADELLNRQGQMRTCYESSTKSVSD